MRTWSTDENKKNLELELKLYLDMQRLCEQFTNQTNNSRVIQLIIDIGFNRCVVEDKLRRFNNAEK